MNVFAFVSLVSAIFCLSLGLLVLYLNPRSKLNRLFFFVTLSGFLYSFTTIMMWIAPTQENALFWHKAGTIWPFFAATVLDFALYFTGSKWVKNKIHYLALYLPAVFFWLVDLMTDYINTPPVMQYWGYNDQASGTWLYVVSTAWSALVPLIAFVLCFKFYYRATDPIQRKRAKYVAAGLSIPIATFIVTNMLARSVNIDVPNLGLISALFFAGLVGYAIVKFDLFALDTTLAAENILTTMPDSLVLTNLDLQIIRINDHLTEFLGYNEEELIGTPLTKLFIANDADRETLEKQMLKDRIVRNYELTAKTKKGEERHVLFSGSIVENKAGQPIGLTFVIHDITELKKIEERLVKAERLASIGELAGQLGHDLRNPLAGIKNGVYLLKKKGNKLTDNERNEILNALELAIENSNRIITSLVDYSSELRFKPQKCTPKSLVDNALAKIKVPNYIKVENTASEAPYLYVDTYTLEKAFASIIENAIDATVAQKPIQIRSAVKDSNVEIIFSDNGEGIPESILPRLFTPLVTTKAKGMGMSLAICKRVVEAHKGKVSVTSAAGEGTTLTISLPLNSEQMHPVVNA